MKKDSLPLYMISQSGSDLLKHWHTGEQLTIWRGVHPLLLAVLISSNTGEWLTFLPILSVILITSSSKPQTLRRDSLSGWVFTHSHQWFRSTQTLERDSLPGWVFTYSGQWFSSAQTLERYSLSGWVHPFLSVVQIDSDTGEGLTPWIGVHPFLSVVQICSSTG